MANPTGKGGFKKGQSGNPKGRPTDYPELKELARTYTQEAIDTLVNVMRQDDDARAKAVAANGLLDRGWGKPSQDVNLGGQKDNPIVVYFNTPTKPK